MSTQLSFYTDREDVTIVVNGIPMPLNTASSLRIVEYLWNHAIPGYPRRCVGFRLTKPLDPNGPQDLPNYRFTINYFGESSARGSAFRQPDRGDRT